MKSAASTGGIGPAIAAGPVFLAFLIPHILAGLTATVSGAVVMFSPKGTRRHVRTGIAYYWALSALTVTAAGLTTIHPARDFPLLLLGLLALALASAGRLARRHPRARPWRAWPGHAPHLLAMAGSYTVMLTAFLVDNGPNIPVAGRLPAIVFALLPWVVAAPLAARSLRRRPGVIGRRLS